jgi:transposase
MATGRIPIAIAKFIPMHQEPKGGQHQNTFGRGCAWYADQGYDSDQIVADAQARGMEVVISPKKNRKIQRPYDKDLYRARHLVENAFLHLKRWRGIATRYAKHTASFLAAVQIRCLLLWMEIS